MCQQGFECSKEKGSPTSNGQPNEPNQRVEGSNVFTTAENDGQVFRTPPRTTKYLCSNFTLNFKCPFQPCLEYCITLSLIS